MRFLRDEAIQHRLADHRAKAGHDATHAVRIGLAGASDPAVLERAAAEDRILITTDTDFPTLLALSGEPIPSVLLLRGIGDASQVTGGDPQRLAVDPGGAPGGRGRRR